MMLLEDDAGTNKSFRYSPLDEAKSEIRLLWLPQTTPQSCSDLNLSLIHTSLQRVQDFVALSYCWGKGGLDHPITVDGGRLDITGSLELALLNLRSSKQGFFLWADAICINQKDNAEKTWQVQMMRSIYQAAVRVLIWLGPSTLETDNAIKGVRELGDELLGIGVLDLVAEKRRQLLPWITQPDDGTQAAVTRQKLVEVMIRYRRAVREDGIDPFWWLSSELATREWFQRVWCVQECVNARIATLRCGDSEIDYTQVQAVFWFYVLFTLFLSGALHGHAADFELANLFNEQKADKFEGPMPMTILNVRQKSLHNTVFSLRDLLGLTCIVPTCGATRSMHATNKRDCVYALLGLATDEAATHITPDYNLSCHDAYVVTARVLLDHGHDDILSLCRGSERKYNLPSWTPDWSTSIEAPWSLPDFRPDRTYNACGYLPKQTTKVNVPANISRSLELDSVMVDTIIDVGEPYTTSVADITKDGKWSDLKGFFCDLNDYLARSARYSAEQKKEAKWRIPIGDLEYDASNRRTIRPSSLSRMEAGYMLAKEILGWSRDGGPLEWFSPKIVQEVESEESPYSCWMYQLRRMYSTRPFLSQDGHVGLCPEETTSGDRIVIFTGAKVPYVVRLIPGGSTWRLVGEAYVHLIMDGEFVSASSQTEVVTLE